MYTNRFLLDKRPGLAYAIADKMETEPHIKRPNPDHVRKLAEIINASSYPSLLGFRIAEIEIGSAVFLAAAEVSVRYLSHHRLQT